MQRYGKEDVSKRFQFVYLKYYYKVLTPLIQSLSAAQVYVENKVKECSFMLLYVSTADFMLGKKNKIKSAGRINRTSGAHEPGDSVEEKHRQE